jgi:SAM-dependent methyltransferase
MELELATALASTSTGWLVERLDSGARADARPADALIEHGVEVRVGNLVALETGADPPRIVWRWKEEGLDPERLRAEVFPRIREAYRGLARAEEVDPRRVVREGYDRIAERYVAWLEQERSAARMRYIELLLDALPAGAHVLDLGCGAGGPTTRALAERFDVTGVDLSPRSVALARRHVPGAKFIEADMSEVDFPTESFSGIAAFYSLIHVPRDDVPRTLARIASWLRPGGWLVASMATVAMRVDYAEDFFGVPMMWSSHDAATNRRLVEEAGLTIVRATEETETEHGRPVTFLWIVARKPER